MSDDSHVDLGEILLVDGGALTATRRIRLEPIAISTAGLRDDEPVRIDVTFISSEGELTAWGEVTFRWEGACRRCLEPVCETATVDFHEVFSSTPEPGETYAIDGDGVDLEPLLIDVVTLSLPLGPLCRPDCPGPQPDRFPVGLESEERAPAVDPRWAALDELRGDD